MDIWPWVQIQLGCHSDSYYGWLCNGHNMVLVAPILLRIPLKQIYFHKGCDYYHRPVQFDKRPCLCNLIRLCHFPQRGTDGSPKFKNEKNAGKILGKSGSLTKCFWNIFLIGGCSQSHTLDKPLDIRTNRGHLNRT